MALLKILLFDGSYKTTPFINRLAGGLAISHQVYITGFNEELPTRVPEVKYVPLGSNQSKWRFILSSLGWGFKSGRLTLFMRAIINLFKGDRQALQKQNLELALQKISPDIIHLQWPSTISWFEEVLEQQQIPVVLSQRGFHNNVRPFVDAENLAYLQKWYPKIAGFHSVSHAMMATGDKIWNAPQKLNRVVYTGLDLKDVSFSESYSPKTPLQLLSIGRSHWIKGYDYVLRACKILKDKNLPFQYTIIGGEGDEELQFLITDLQLNDCVLLEKRKPQNDVFKIMREVSLLLMPSLEEGIPNVVVEAMAIGLPVISTDCGGVPELIEDKVNGWLVPMRDAEAMAEAIVAFTRLSLPQLEGVRCAARKKVERQHGMEQMVLGMEGLYYQVIR